MMALSCQRSPSIGSSRDCPALHLASTSRPLRRPRGNASNSADRARPRGYKSNDHPGRLCASHMKQVLVVQLPTCRTLRRCCLLAPIRTPAQATMHPTISLPATLTSPLKRAKDHCIGATGLKIWPFRAASIIGHLKFRGRGARCHATPRLDS